MSLEWFTMPTTESSLSSSISTHNSTMGGGAASMAASSPERGCRRQPTRVETACGCGAAKLRSNRLPTAVGSGQSSGAAGSGGCAAGRAGKPQARCRRQQVPLKGGGRRPGVGIIGASRHRDAAEAVRKSDSKSVVSVASAEDGHSLARLERINRVGGLAVVERSGTTDCRPTPL